MLDTAIASFASKGFTAASLSELTAATGLSTGSLYKAFGDKDGVFVRALARYIALHEAAIASALAPLGDVLVIMPPLAISPEQLEEMLTIIHRSLDEVTP